MNIKRNPKRIEFVSSIEEDSKKRDLTINALYYDIEKQEIIDYVGGIEDIENNIVKTVGEPQERFDEDSLRKLRVVRFAARTGSGIDLKTSEALKENNSLEGVSPERIRDELFKGILSAKNTSYFLKLLTEYNFWEQIFPGLNISQVSSDAKYFPLVLALLLQNNNPIVVSKKLNELKYTSREVSQTSFLILFQELAIENAFKLKKIFNNSKLEWNILEKFSKFTGKPNLELVKTFIMYTQEQPVSGKELQNQGFSGIELGKEIERLETEKFKSLL